MVRCPERRQHSRQKLESVKTTLGRFSGCLTNALFVVVMVVVVNRTQKSILVFPVFLIKDALTYAFWVPLNLTQ